MVWLMVCSTVWLIVWLMTGASLLQPAWGQAAGGDPAALHLKVVEGDGATYAPGSRATRGVGVMVTDENDRPVEGATVGFALPMSGPGGEFASGGKTEIITTKGDGLATAWGMRWNRAAGPFEIRVTAVKGQAKAGMSLTQYLSGLPQSSSARTSGGSVGGGGHKWVWIVLAGAAAAGAVGFAEMNKGSSSSASASTVSTAASTVQIGAPSVTVGHP